MRAAIVAAYWRGFDNVLAVAELKRFAGGSAREAVEVGLEALGRLSGQTEENTP